MRRKVLVILLTFSLVLSFMPMVAFADNEAEGSDLVNETVEAEKVEPKEPVQDNESAEGAEMPVDETAEEEPAEDTKVSSDEMATEEESAEDVSQQTVKREALKALTGNTDPAACTHKNTDTYYEWYDEDVKYNDTGDHRYHRVTGQGEEVTYCEDCGKDLSRKAARIDIEHEHDYDDNQVCRNCGHKNPCTHENIDTYYEWYDEDVEYSDIGDNDYHNVTGQGEEVGFCLDCGMELWREEVIVDLDDDHDYDDNQVCRNCGHRNSSAEDSGRIFGKMRYDTAIKVAEKYKSSSGKFENVIVAYGRNYPDALSGGYLAKVRNAPILLVEPSQEGKIVDYICRNISSGGTVYILGGTGVVSSAFENKVKVRGVYTKRLGGKDRYETNMKILKEAGVKAEDILVCTGNGYADSLSASAVGKPILLVGNTLTDSQKKYIKSLSTKQFYLIGGTGAVKPAVEKGLKDLGFTPNRLAGKTRYETSTAVAKKFFSKASTVILAYAQNFPDGLSGGPLAMLKNAPIVLTDSKKTAAAKAYVKSAGVVESITLGGPALISDAAVKAIMGK